MAQIYGENTTIRAWLNAIENAGNIIWPGNNPPNTKVPLSPFMPYVDEDGFLSERNFSISELSVMKTVSQWQILGPKNAHLSTNGLKSVFKQTIILLLVDMENIMCLVRVLEILVI